jgi:hypothetical protein
MRYALIACVAMIAMTSCKHECESGETRCNGNNSEMCSKDNVWDVVMDCTELSRSTELELKCFIEPEGAVCVMVEE